MASRAGQHYLTRLLRQRAPCYLSRSTAPSSSVLPSQSQAAVTSQDPRSYLLAIWGISKTSNPGANTRSLFAQRRCLCNAANHISSQDVLESTADSSLERSPTDDQNSDPAVYKSSKRHDLAMLFTCKVCETRSGKTMSRTTYETGIVIVRCPKCRNLHLIADRLGWFGEPGSVEDFLKQQGVSVRKGLEESYEFSVEDLAGWTPPLSEPKP